MGEYTSSFPTLSTHGYGLIFSFKEGVEKIVTKGDNKGKSYLDNDVSITICKIIADFLENSHEITFVILQCEKYKEEKFFHHWFNNYEDKNKYMGIGIEFDFADEKQFFGFISGKNNPEIKKAVEELETFSFEISRND